MQLITVDSEASWKLFHRVPHRIYKNDPHWIAPLEMDVRNIFRPEKNTAWSEGTAQCFVLLDEQGAPAGRIAAFVDHAANRHQEHPLGGIGFFECIDREEYARALLEHAEAFLAAQGVEIIEGPVNFGERDKFWGLLVKGFLPPLYQENYNPPYYEGFFLNAGFIPFEQVLTYAGDSSRIPVERFVQIAQRQKERHPMRVEGLDYNQLEKFSRDFAVVYNASFAAFDHFHPISQDLVRNMLVQAKPIADPQIAALAYYEDKPAGFIALYPDINPMLRHAKGKLNWWTTPLFLFKKRFATTFTAKGMGFGIHPDYQSKGIFALLMEYLCSPRNVYRYPRMCLAGIRAHNHAIRSIYSKMDVEIERVHVSYRKPLKAELEITPYEFAEI